VCEQSAKSTDQALSDHRHSICANKIKAKIIEVAAKMSEIMCVKRARSSMWWNSSERVSLQWPTRVFLFPGQPSGVVQVSANALT
jgi:hypothetical protein